MLSNFINPLFPSFDPLYIIFYDCPEVHTYALSRIIRYRNSVSNGNY